MDVNVRACQRLDVCGCERAVRGFYQTETSLCSCCVFFFQGFKTKDGHIVVAAGNEKQFVRVCQVSPFTCTDIDMLPRKQLA